MRTHFSPTYQDVAEKDPEAAKKLNVAVSREIASIAKELDIVLIYIR